MKNKISIIVVAILSIIAYFNNSTQNSGNLSAKNVKPSVLVDAYNNHKSNVIVQTKAKVIKILSDDLQGSKHQRFIIKLNSGQTILVAHNIDLAPKVKDLKKGSNIELKGEYEWNNKGGVIHWTHHDPSKRHIDGWIKHNNKTYK
jgi:hypothetical protein